MRITITNKYNYNYNLYL